MTPRDILKRINTYLDTRKNIKHPNIRKSALSKIISFIENTKIYLSKDQLNLPERKDFEAAYMNHNKKDLNGAEKHIIKLIYDYVNPITINNRSVITQQNSNTSTTSSIVKSDISKIERDLIQGDFYSVNELSKSLIPDKPGLYCIKLRKDVILPSKYGEISNDGIIYIGKASKSILQRLWEEELNHKRPATFFRSIGAILGYMPPKGSLPKGSNYKFNETDTHAIREWMRQSLLVRFISINDATLTEFEESLIKKYKPLINILYNPNPSKELKAARAKCIQYGRGDRPE